MAFREKNAWIAITCTLVIWGYYFSSLWAGFSARDLDGDAIFWLFVWCMGITIVLMLALNLAVAWLARQQFGAEPDERERQIDARANRIGLNLIEFASLGIIVLSPWISGIARSDFPADPAGSTAIIMANALLFVLVLSAVVREIVQIVHFRMMD